MPVCQAAHYDLVIVGAGMVGASLACILERAPQTADLNILLVESAPIDLAAPPAQPSFDARSTVLSHGTVSYLTQLGLWQSLADSAAPIKRIHVSDQGNFGAVRMDSREQGVDALGHVIENRLLGAVFNQALADAGNLEVCCGVMVTAVTPIPDGMQVQLDSGDEQQVIRTALVVLAEGGRSGLCEKLGIHRAVHPYDQEAVIANVAFNKPHDNVAFERFTPNGPLAFLPLPDMDGQHRAALVWTRKAGAAQELLALSQADFLATLQAEFGSRLGKLVRVGERHSYPLSLVEAEEQVRPGLVLLGNVAHSLHPVAGQGLNLSLREAGLLASELAVAMREGQPIGQLGSLKRYLEHAADEQHFIARSTDLLATLFNRRGPLLDAPRNLSLALLDLVPAARARVADLGTGQRSAGNALGG